MIQLQDKFQGADNTPIQDHVPNVGGPWVSGDNGFEILGNKLSLSDTSGEAIGPLKFQTARVFLVFTMNFADAPTSLVLTVADQNGLYQLQFSVLGDGSITCTQKGFGLADLVLTGPVLDPAVSHVVEASVGSQASSVFLDGMLIFCARRLIPPGPIYRDLFIDVTRPSGNSPLVSYILVTR